MMAVVTIILTIMTAITAYLPNGENTDFFSASVFGVVSVLASDFVSVVMMFS